MFHFFVTNLESLGSFDVALLYNSAKNNESKDKFKIAFSCSSETKKIVAPSSFSNFSVKLVCGGILVSVCLDKSIPISL